MPKVSVILPNYNHERFLPSRISSILNQAFQDFELIILDDQSTDESIRFIESFRSHPKVSYIVFNTHNSGSTFKQWKKGLALAQGDLIWIAESDDYSSKDFLSTMVVQFDLHKKLGIAYCQSIRVDENNNELGDWTDHTNDLDADRWYKPYVKDGVQEIENYMAFKNTIPNASGALFSKKALLEAGGPDSRFILNGDWCLYIKLLSKGYSVAYVPDKLNFFRQHSAKVTRSAERKGVNILEAFKILQYLITGGQLIASAQSRILDHYFGHYLPQIFRDTVSPGTKFKTLRQAFIISPRRTLNCLRSQQKKFRI